MPLDENLDLANRVYGVIDQATQMTSLWISPLIHKHLDGQVFVRNKIFPIFVLGLADGVGGHETRIRDLVVKAQKVKNDAAICYLGYIKEYLSLAQELLGLFSKEEMVFLSEERHRSVHGHREEAHKPTRKVRWVKDGQLIAEKIPSEV